MILLNSAELPDSRYSDRAIPDRRERTDRELSECADRILEVCGRYGLTTVNTHYLLARPPFTERLYAEGVGLSVWTVNDEDLIRRFLKENVYALTTRSIAAALKEIETADRLNA